MEDFLLKTFFEKERWENAIQTGIDKEIDPVLLRELSSPEKRVELYRQIKNGQYEVAPPHEALIPKDDGTFRTVYVNEGIDRVILAIVNDMFFELCPELVHPCCTSYQKGIGCGKIVQKASTIIKNAAGPTIGMKADLSKYFDSVPINFIDDVFDYIENKFGKSKLMDVVRNYYHMDAVIDINKELIEKYSSLRQGCAIAAFLADAVLYDIDDKISKLDVYYVRYSDDILIIGNEWEKGYKILADMLAEKSLILNPKKVEILQKDRWFKFLGFTIKNDKISLSKSRIKSFQKEIEKRTIDGNTHDEKQIINAVYHYLYKGCGEYSWATSVLPVINVDKDVNTLNGFVMDAIRAAITGKHRIGGLGVTTDTPECTISRGTGRHVKSNKMSIPHLDDYKVTMMCMKNAICTSKEAYTTLTSVI